MEELCRLNNDLSRTFIPLQFREKKEQQKKP